MNPRAGAAAIFLAALSVANFSDVCLAASQERLPVAFKWRSEYWPKGWRHWSQTAPDQWTEKYENGGEKKFRVLGRIKVGCEGLHLRAPDGTYEVFVPGSGCKSKWLLFRNVGLYAPTPQWIGQAEITEIEYKEAEPKAPPAR